MLKFFSWEKFEYGKNLCVSLIPYPKEPPKHPLYGAESKIFWGLLHLEHTFRTHILFTFITYIYKLHLQLTFCRPSVPRSTAGFSLFSPTMSLPSIRITFINYTYNSTYNSTCSSACNFFGLPGLLLTLLPCSIPVLLHFQYPL